MYFVIEKGRWVLKTYMKKEMKVIDKTFQPIYKCSTISISWRFFFRQRPSWTSTTVTTLHLWEKYKNFSSHFRQWVIFGEHLVSHINQTNNTFVTFRTREVDEVLSTRSCRFFDSIKSSSNSSLSLHGCFFHYSWLCPLSCLLRNLTRIYLELFPGFNCRRNLQSLV